MYLWPIYVEPEEREQANAIGKYRCPTSYGMIHIHAITILFRVLHITSFLLI